MSRAHPREPVWLCHCDCGREVEVRESDLLSGRSTSCQMCDLTDDDIERIWGRWNELPDTHPTPVTQIAGDLSLDKAAVAAVVYPIAEFGVWDESQEET